MSKQLKALAASYSRTVIAAVLAVYMTGNTSPTDLGKAAIAALLPPLMRWANPKDQSFGRSA
ncbi:hypothetical protein UFOVP1047_5 [uncultured Caudovirales phage]|uniref:Uncharacterized protein n=1 Tax=uncultured Caudovirales phage TaxID=2100421 RepID=A0A6J5P7H1_9CAUD|nr:hypothetical protein UFOVP487_4 [uncultured Caudovirales phage]CAB4167483.1 hypothetical protein UFOVP869_19 [uncultured Caudovirales phage]CAB4180049.1 hypothetical protein UFOVP1047_5 [uncultured Caudovirales phage]